MYKEKPLVRSGKTIYYGFSYEPYVVMINIMTTKKVGEMDVADRVSVQLISTDPDVRPAERIIKKSEKKGLFAAMDVGAVWLERALAKK
ncbi:MAG: hypothetical protein IJL26_04310 [Clostridia bacterium]|nr:hypothetical protein [Clostridia bacterium]